MRLARAHRIYEVEAVVTKARTHTKKKKIELSEHQVQK